MLRAIPHARSQRERRRLEQLVVLENIGVAQALARRYSRRHIDGDDLEQVAYVGLVQAVQRFDVSREKDFLSFAVPTIVGELKRHFRDRGWHVRPPRRVTELQARISAAAEDLGQALGRSPRPRELAKTLGCSEDDVIEALTCDGAFAPSSLDAPTGPDGTATVGEALRTEDSEEQRADARLLLGPTVRALSARDRLIIELRFFHGWTQQEIGEEIGVTQMQVSRLLDRIFTDLRKAIGEHEAG